MKEIKIALIGCGNAGKAFLKMLEQKSALIEKTYDTKVVVAAVATKSHGNQVNGKETNLSTMEIIETADYDVMIEITPLEIFTGQPAIDHIKCAMNRGKDVVTANKGPIAWAYNELKNLAKEKQVKFYFETTVMDGTPVFNLVEETLPLCKVEKVEGILNSTTNFILDQLALGEDMDKIMEEGRQRGFVEADPSMDIEGYDAAAKTAALLNVLMDANITPDKIKRQGIENIGEKQVKEALAQGCKIKLVCSGYLEDGKVIGQVEPKYVKLDDPFASISGTSSIVSITTDLMGKIAVTEIDPEIDQTAYGIFGDLMRVIRNKW